jgi:hypothetical protein
LRIISAWLNHFDTKAHNSLDGYVGNDGEGYVRHYLIDFGSTLGSGALQPMKPEIGIEMAFDIGQFLKNLFTLGIYVSPYERADSVIYPSVGRYSTKFFSPVNYKFHMPNPAFMNMTDRDGFWGAKIVMSFTDKQLATAVEQGQYSNPDAAAYLLDVLKSRRDMVGRYWFKRVNPLDAFTIQKIPGDTYNLTFNDLAVKYGVETAKQTRYRFSIKNQSSGKLFVNSQVHTTAIPLPAVRSLQEPGDDRTHGEHNKGILELSIQTRRGTDSDWSKKIKVYIEPVISTGEYTLLGILRED